MKKLLFLLMVFITPYSFSQEEFNAELFLYNMANVVSQPKKDALDFINQIGFTKIKKNLFYLRTKENEETFLVFEKDYVIFKTQENLVDPLLEYTIENLNFEVEDFTEDGCEYYLYRYSAIDRQYVLEIKNCDNYDYVSVKEIK